jgi:C-terminal processing protease CtpA/Prc
MISGIGVSYPDKTPTQQIGIVPDVKVPPTAAGIRPGRDEALEEALRQILGRNVLGTEIEKMSKP